MLRCDGHGSLRAQASTSVPDLSVPGSWEQLELARANLGVAKR